MTIYGTITNAYFGKTKFNKDDLYHVSLKISKEQRDALADACRPSFDGMPDGFLPKWYKDEKSEYINFKSKFDITTIMDGEELQSLDGFLKKFGNINGSKAGINVTIKEGAIYPHAIKIYELATTDFSDLFDDELPF